MGISAKLSALPETNRCVVEQLFSEESLKALSKRKLHKEVIKGGISFKLTINALVSPPFDSMN